MNYLKSIKLWKWILLLIGAWLLFELLYALASGLPEMFLPDNWVRAVVYIICSVVLLALYYWLVRMIEERPVAELNLKKFPVYIGLGFLCGTLLMAVEIAVLAVLGLYKIDTVQFDGYRLLFSFCFFLVVAVGEEIVSRGILFRFIDSRWNFIAAVIVSALIFGFMHAPNPGATIWSSCAIAIDAGIVLTSAYKLSGSLYFPMGIHWGWNFVQGNIFGCAVSGVNMDYSLITPDISGPELLTGGLFGPEASIFNVIIDLGVLVYLILRYRKNKFSAL